MSLGTTRRRKSQVPPFHLARQRKQALNGMPIVNEYMCMHSEACRHTRAHTHTHTVHTHVQVCKCITPRYAYFMFSYGSSACMHPPHMPGCMYVCMYVRKCACASAHMYMYVWIDGRMDGRTDGRMDGWMHGCMDAWMDGWMDGWTDGWMDVRMRTYLCMHIFHRQCEKKHPEIDL